MQSKSLPKNIKRITLWVHSSVIRFLHEIHRLSVFSKGKESKKVFFMSVFWYKMGAQQLPYLTFSLNRLILDISISEGGHERYISGRILRKKKDSRKRYFTATVSTFPTA